MEARDPETQAEAGESVPDEPVPQLHVEGGASAAQPDDTAPVPLLRPKERSPSAQPDEAELAPAEPAQTLEAPSWSAPVKTMWTRVAPFLPWASLALSVVGAVLMDRRQSQAGLVAAASAASWIVLLVVALAHRPRAQGAESTGALTKALRFTVVAANQSLVQMSLFFCAPLYAQAFVVTPLELVFAVLFVLAVGVSLWDPLCERVLLHPRFGPLLLAFSSFVAWNAVLPMLGIRHRTAVWIAAFAVSVTLPVVQLVARAPRKHLVGSLYVALGLPLVLAVGGVRALPPAPLNIVEAAIGTRVVERELVDPTQHFARSPGMLVCYTAIRAPHGLKEELVHEWRHAGELTHRIVLDVRGGRRAGFRTWSRLPVGPRASGEYRCDVVTTLGQTLGSSRVSIGR